MIYKCNTINNQLGQACRKDEVYISLIHSHHLDNDNREMIWWCSNINGYYYFDCKARISGVLSSLMFLIVFHKISKLLENACSNLSYCNTKPHTDTQEYSSIIYWSPATVLSAILPSIKDHHHQIMILKLSIHKSQFAVALLLSTHLVAQNTNHAKKKYSFIHLEDLQNVIQFVALQKKLRSQKIVRQSKKSILLL